MGISKNYQINVIPSAMPAGRQEARNLAFNCEEKNEIPRRPSANGLLGMTNQHSF